MRWQHSRVRRNTVPLCLLIFIIFMSYNNYISSSSSSDSEDTDETDYNIADSTNHFQYQPERPTVQGDSSYPVRIESDDIDVEDDSVEEVHTAFGFPERVFGPHKFSKHVFRSDGLLEVNPEGRHPIYDLIQDAERHWKAKLEKQSKTLSEACLEYKRRYKRDPPPGFDKWWDYVQQHNVQLPDEYDFLHHNIEMFWGVDPLYLEEQRQIWEKHAEVFTLGKDLPNEPVQLLELIAAPNGDLENGRWRANLQLELVHEIGHHIPPFRASFVSGDVPYQFFGYSMKKAAMDSAALGTHMDFKKLPFQPYLGWASACPPTAPLHGDIWENHPSPSDFHMAKPKTFIHDHLLSMDPCIHPDLVHIVGYLSNHQKGPGPSETFIPAFAISSTEIHADILAVSPEGWTEDVGEDIPWEQKTDARLFWRGSNTGASFADGPPWNISHRIRLIHQSSTDGIDFDVLEPTSQGDIVGSAQTRSSTLLNSRLMDISFTERAIQCDAKICELLEEAYTFKDKMTQDEANQYKFMMDVDGNAWSARFKRLMSTNSCVLKSTMFPEWYADRIQAWLHYVPVKVDLADLYDILTFFRGSPDAPNENDHLAASIAKAGKEWSNTFYRKEDMTAYMFRLYLEYSRVMNPERDNLRFEL